MATDFSNLKVNGPLWSAEAEVLSLLATSPVASGLLLEEDFSAYQPQEDPLNWRDTAGSHSLEEDDNLFKTIQFGNQVSFGTRSSAGNIHTHYNETGALNWTNYEFTGRLRFSGDTSGIGLTFFSQYPQAKSYYRIRRESSSNNTFILTTDPDTDQTGRFKGDTQSGFAPQKNTWCRFKIVVVDEGDKTTIKARFWQEGAAEPADFQIDAFDDKPDRLTAGTVGVWTNGAGIKYVDDLKVVGTGIPRFLALRNIFLDKAPGNTVLGVENVLAPGMTIALCRIKKATVTLGDEAFEWVQNPDNTAPVLLEESEVREAVAAGDLSLLLLQTDPAGWPEASHGALPAFDCLNGFIDLDTLDEEDRASSRLLEALRLEAASPDLSLRSGSSFLEGAMTLHGSGLTVFGGVQLPWQDEAIQAPFMLSSQFAIDQETVYRLRPEYNRMMDTEKRDFEQAWLALSRIINPQFPLNALTFPASSSRWTTLEIADPLDLPGIYWLIDPAESQDPLPLRFEPGEVNLLFTDQPAYNLDNPPRSLAKIILEDLKIERDGEDGLMMSIGDLSAANPEAPCYTYQAKRTEEALLDESVVLSNIPLAFSAVDIPRRLRTDQEIEEPGWSKDDNTDLDRRPVLWASMPLEDGWVQWPVPNLTEQIYLDSGLAQTNILSENQAASLLQGAVSVGNQRVEVLNAYPEEQPWSLTLLNGQNLSAEWKFSRQDEDLTLDEVNLKLDDPELIVEGMMWIGTGKPTVNDAVADLDDWVDGLTSVLLRSYRPEKDLFPSAIVCRLSGAHFSLRKDELTTAQFDEWEMGYDVNPAIFENMVAVGVMPSNAFSRHLPLAWMRHMSLPMIQALPLTQSNNPPNYPSASRQLAPFQLNVSDAAEGALPENWVFGVSGSNSASRWPRLGFMPEPFAGWVSLFDLPLVSLSIPGLILDPDVEIKDTGLTSHLPPPQERLNLPLQYRYDLPFTDEVNSLAKLPEVPRDPDASSPLPDSPPLEPPKPLQRETLPDFWADLSTRASLAQSDAVKAFHKNGASPAMKYVVEPEQWDVKPAFDLTAYPGKITLDNADEDSPAPLILEKESALRGVDGQFSQSGDDKIQRLSDGADHDAAAFQVTAGSMAAYRNSDGTFRDQRGLSRANSELADAFISTQMQLKGKEVINLTTTRSTLSLQVGSASPWQLWFKDLPLDQGTFDREDARSPAAEGVNDPGALSRSYNHLNGYEWRLASAATQNNNATYLTLFNLHFYPLTLDLLTFEGNTVSKISITGRLQLPLNPPVEITDISNAVQLQFERAGDRLELTSLELCEGGPATWPLKLEENEAAKGVSINWGNVEIATDDTTGIKSLVFSEVTLHFFLFDVAWTVGVSGFSISEEPGVDLEINHQFEVPEDPRELQPEHIELFIDLASNVHAHTARLWLDVQLGDAQLRDAQLGDDERNAFKATVIYDLNTQTEKDAVWEEGTIFNRLPLAIPPPSDEFSAFLSDRSVLQFNWQRFEVDDENAAFFFLPGFQLAQPAQQGTPGFASVTFNASGIAGGIPRLNVESAFVETVLTCDWGLFLQDADIAAVNLIEQVFGSSAGAVTAGFTSVLIDSVWTESIVLNGVLEITNLISWPLQLRHDETRGILTMPSILPDAQNTVLPLSHARHTMRVLFNQHAIPQDILRAGTDAVLYNLQEDKNWQFLAIVEHQFVDASSDLELEAINLENDLRWTALQEVRFILPKKFKGYLEQYDPEQFKILSPEGGVEPLGEAGQGYFKKALHGQLLEDLSASLSALADDTLLVEGSAPHWVSPAPISRSSSSTFQFQPTGNVHGAMSNVEDFKPQGLEIEDWVLITAPFLGRLQPLALDGLFDGSLDEEDVANPFRQDPVQLIHKYRGTPEQIPPLSLAFGSWSREATPVELIFPLFDSTLGRSWPRLDAIAVEENFFRLYNPPQEDPPTALFSISASLNDTVAQLSRPAALQNAYDGRAYTYPPSTERNDLLPLPNDLTGEVEWRPERVLVSQAVVSGEDTAIPYGWHVQYPVLRSLRDRVSTVSPNFSARFAAATVMPSPAPAPENQFHPHHLAISPYLSLEFRPATNNPVPLLISSELLCVDPRTRALKPCASHLWQLSSEALETRLQDHAETRITWARQTHRRIAPDSPVAVLRLRIVNDLADAERTATPTVLTTYSFEIVTELESTAPLAGKMAGIRSTVKNLKFREGQFGGLKIPGTLRPFELAPPMVTGFQPVRLEKELAGDNQRAWPWGYSAVRVSTQATPDKTGVAGIILDDSPDGNKDGLTFWWQHPNYIAQFRGHDSEAPAGGLPEAFRASAISSFLPVNPNPAMPEISPSVMVEDNASKDQIWQPVLPGSTRYFMVGMRAGVMHALRHQLLRHRPFAGELASGMKGETVASGSVLVQHRTPRPVTLPANAGRLNALQTWGSYFDPASNLFVSGNPLDEAFVAACGDEPARSLKFTLISPALGAITPDWAGEVICSIETFSDDPSNLGTWSLSMQVADDIATVEFVEESAGSTTERKFKLAPLSGDVDPLEVLGGILQRKSPGDTLNLDIEAIPSGVTEGFTPRLVIPLRLRDPDRLRLPLVPSFVHFEDPEYNRQLASSSAHSTSLTQFTVVDIENGPEENTEIQPIKLSADRKEYNLDSVIFFRFDIGDGLLLRNGEEEAEQNADQNGEEQPLTVVADVILQRVDKNGIEQDLVHSFRAEQRSNTLLKYSLHTVQKENEVVFNEGDKIQFKVVLQGIEVKRDNHEPAAKHVAGEFRLGVDIVFNPVTPSVESAFGLLRWQEMGDRIVVDCPRFAWGPEPARIELVCPDDLLTEVVRRRAVFKWHDSVRPGRNVKYAIQKITPTGATHFPDR